MQRHQLKLLITMVLVLLGHAACNGDVPNVNRYVYLGDCPQDSVFVVVRDTVASTADTVTDIPLATNKDNLPEFHDCQRLIKGHAYGPLVAIWAYDELDDLVNHLDTIPDIGKPKLGLAAAEILNFDSLYEPLGIEQGFSCLYLMKELSVWRARVVPTRNQPGGCRQPLDFSSNVGHELEVKPIYVVVSDLADVPPVARWDWDRELRENYIGVRCGGQWCEIGRPDFTPSLRYDRTSIISPSSPITAPKMIGKYEEIAGPILPSDVDRTLTIKGWYDEQYLALPISTDPSAPKMTSFMATAFPHPSLDRMVGVEQFTTWVPSAYVIMEDAYPGKLPLSKGINEIFMCQGSECQASLPTGTMLPECAHPTDPQWWVKIVAEDKSATYRCMTRRAHEGMGVIPVGTVRWHWSEKDETLWVRCAAGCCTTN